MDIDRFWELIEQARANAGSAADQAVRDYDDPDDDPDRDYWDFDDEDVQSAFGLVDPELAAVTDAARDAASGDPRSASPSSASPSSASPSSASPSPASPGGDLSSEGAAGGRLVDVSDLPEIAEDEPGDGEFEVDDEFDDDEFEVDDEFDDDEFDDDDELIDPVAVALVDLLAQLPAAEIAAFDNLFDVVREDADRDDLANAATLIEHGFLGDDSFDDFRAGLVALGRETFAAALQNPDSLAEHPVVREIAEANDPRWVGREDLVYAASHAYARVTGEDAMAFYDFAEKIGEEHPPSWPPTPREPDESHWEITDQAETRRRLPRLSEMFYERSMRNRERALAKLGIDE